MDKRFERLKSELFMDGAEAIEDFLGFPLSENGFYNLSKDAIDRLMNEVYEQMPDDILDEYYKKYNI